MLFSVAMNGSPKYIAIPAYRRAITSFKIVESGMIWYCLIQLVEPHRTRVGIGL